MGPCEAIRELRLLVGKLQALPRIGGVVINGDVAPLLLDTRDVDPILERMGAVFDDVNAALPEHFRKFVEHTPQNPGSSQSGHSIERGGGKTL